MSKYLERNESIGAIQEVMIRAVMSRHSKEDLVKEVEEGGIPVAAEILDIIREEIDKILWERTYDLLDYAAVMFIWKVAFGSSFRHVFFSIMHRLVSEVDPKDLEAFCKPSKEWRINRFAHRKHRCRKSIY